MKIFIIVSVVIFLSTTVYADETEKINGKEAIVVADQRYWWKEEGNLCVSIGAKFNSAEKKGQTLDLLKEIGTFHSKDWKLHEVLVSADFNANGDVATWLVSGPKPLLLSYVKDLEASYKDRSLFYSFSYSVVDCKPTAFFEDDGTFPDYED